MQRFLLIALAGAAGTGARYLVGLWAEKRLGSAFPYGTLLVNVSGCFLMALVLGLTAGKQWPETTRLAITVGFLGGFTTYSSFNYETSQLASTGSIAAASLNVAATLAGGVAAGLLGLLIARALID